MTATKQRLPHVYEPLGSARTLFSIRDQETLMAGPAGTGKSRACLEWLNLVCITYPGTRALMGRKTRRSLTQSGMVTYKDHVIAHGVNPKPKFHSGDQAYRYSNGSQIVVSGFDDPEKIKSTEFDVAYIQEATELTEEDWELVTTRIGRGSAVPYGRIVADCNPSAPTHWIRRRAQSGKLTMLESRHQENPVLWDMGLNTWTLRGLQYLAILENLSGVRRARLLEGKWAAAEGIIYEGWDRAKHLIDRVPFAPGTALCPAGVPSAWRRFWSVDFGYTNPFVWQAWAQDPDGRLYRYRELYRTQRLVEDWAKQIKALTVGEPRPDAVICDHDAEDRATFERHTGLQTVPARKDVSPGIQAVQARLRDAGDGRPRLFLVADALEDPDADLAAAHLPTCTEDEIESYVWMKTIEGKANKEQPEKLHDHGMDATRYLVAHFDLGQQDTMVAPDISISGESYWREDV